VKKYVHILAKIKFDVDRVKSKKSEIKLNRDFSDENKKKDECLSRLCIDFRRINKLIIPEYYSFPTINDVIDKVENCKYFTVININSAFWCILQMLEDREKISFIR